MVYNGEFRIELLGGKNNEEIFVVFFKGCNKVMCIFNVCFYQSIVLGSIFGEIQYIFVYFLNDLNFFWIIFNDDVGCSVFVEVIGNFFIVFVKIVKNNVVFEFLNMC